MIGENIDMTEVEDAFSLITKYAEAKRERDQARAEREEIAMIADRRLREWWVACAETGHMEAERDEARAQRDALAKALEPCVEAIRRAPDDAFGYALDPETGGPAWPFRDELLGRAVSALEALEALGEGSDGDAQS